MIRHFTLSDLEQISDIHIQSLREDFLPSLGSSFLTNFYKGILNKTGIFGFVDEQNGNISGFVIGTTDMQQFFKTALSANFLTLSVLLALQVIKKPYILKNILQTFLYPNKDVGPKAELVIIAVNEKFRGQGIGRKLVNALEKEMKKRKVREYKLTVTKRNKGANAFYASLGFKKIHEFNLYNKDWNVISKAIK